MTTRRTFITSTAGAAAALGMTLSGCTNADPTAPPARHRRSSLDILILGGTGFIGPHMVRRARARGHSVTLFNRGRSNRDLFPDLETLIGDRDGGLEALEGRRWDAVIDNSGYVPRHVRDSAELLGAAARQYLFISSISAYADFSKPDIDEDYALGTMPDETVEEVTGETYGPMKALCERAVAKAFGARATIVRPGYIVGPGDRTDRWTYWPLRIRAGGDVLVPGSPDDPVQFIDARDLARFVIHALENSIVGTFNAVGPADAQRMGAMLETMKTLTASDATFTYADGDWLREQGATFPIWAAPSGDTVGVHRVSNARAIAAGMTFTPLEITVRDTLAWWDALDSERRIAMRSGLRVSSTPPQGFTSPALSLDEQMALEAELLAQL